MLTYISGSINGYTIRTEVVAPISGTYNFGALYLQDMTTQVNSTATLSYVSYNPYESLLSFTASISDVNIAQEFRAFLTDASFKPIWHGSIQVYMSQSNAPQHKSIYQQQNDQYISNVSTNEYIIMD